MNMQNGLIYGLAKMRYNTHADEGDGLMENETKRYESGGVINELRIIDNLATECLFKAFPGREIRNIPLDEARKILDRALGDRSFSDYIRMERDGL